MGSWFAFDELSPCVGERPAGAHAESTDVVVWWLSEGACRRIGEPEEEGPPPALAGFPRYFVEQFCSRSGRSGRGRLWVHADLEALAPSIPADLFAGPAGRVITDPAHDCGGIVVRRADFDWRFYSLPGFATDLALNDVPVPRAPDWWHSAD
jgi:hypothetical protein